MTAKRKSGQESAPTGLLVPEKLATLVHYLRREKVILDSDLAELYGVETGALNRAVKRNIERFPADFMFQLTAEEEAALRCQSGILNADPANLRSQIAIAKTAEANLKCQNGISSFHGGRRTLPYAFTEQGVAMLSSVLRSERAVEVNIAIMRTFVQLRRLMDSNALLAEVIFISASQHLSISAFTSRTRLPHHPIRTPARKTTQTPKIMMEDRRSWIDDVTERQLDLPLPIQKSTINHPQSLPRRLLNDHCSIGTSIPPLPMVFPLTSRAARTVRRLRPRCCSDTEPSDSVKICTLTPFPSIHSWEIL